VVKNTKGTLGALRSALDRAQWTPAHQELRSEPPFVIPVHDYPGNS